MPVDMQYLAFGIVSRERHSRVCCLHIQAWASALPSDIDKAMREASSSRTVTGTDSYAFPFKITANEGMTEANIIYETQFYTQISGYYPFGDDLQYGESGNRRV